MLGLMNAMSGHKARKEEKTYIAKTPPVKQARKILTAFHVFMRDGKCCPLPISSRFYSA